MNDTPQQDAGITRLYHFLTPMGRVAIAPPPPRSGLQGGVTLEGFMEDAGSAALGSLLFCQSIELIGEPVISPGSMTRGQLAQQLIEVGNSPLESSDETAASSGWASYRAVFLSAEVQDLIRARLDAADVIADGGGCQGGPKKKRKLDAGPAPAADVSWTVCCLDGATFSVVVPEQARVAEIKRAIATLREVPCFTMELFVKDVEEPLDDVLGSLRKTHALTKKRRFGEFETRGAPGEIAAAHFGAWEAAASGVGRASQTPRGAAAEALSGEDVALGLDATASNVEARVLGAPAENASLRTASFRERANLSTADYETVERLVRGQTSVFEAS